jgi:hypothetical protein
MDVLGFQTLNMFIPSSTTLERRKVKKNKKKKKKLKTRKYIKQKVSK